MWAWCAGMIDVKCGDCLDVMRSMSAESFDAVVTDPPWMDYKTGWYDASEHHRPIAAIDPNQYCSELYRLCKPISAVLLWCRWDCFDRHAEALASAGFRVRNCVVWAKPNHTAGDLTGNFGNKHEMAVFAVKGKWRRHGKREVNLWIEPHLFTRAKRDHPTEKPIGLMRRSVAAMCPPGGTVLDPFAGSGTTLVAAAMEGRSAIGIEIDPAYVEIIRRRIPD